MTEEEISSARLIREGEERQIRLARDASMNEDWLNDDSLHRSGEEK